MRQSSQFPIVTFSAIKFAVAVLCRANMSAAISKKLCQYNVNDISVVAGRITK